MATLTKCQISDEEFYSAYYGHPGTPSEKAAADNRAIIAKVTSKYRRQLSDDVLESCGMEGLLKALEKHEDGRGQKFTTSVWYFVDKACLHALRRNKRWARSVTLTDITPPQSNESDDRASFHLLECVDLLPAHTKKLLDQYYRQELTLEQVAARNLVSKETARIRISRAVDDLRRVLEHEE